MLGSGEPRETAMADGLILLVFLGILVAFFTVRVRRRMGIASNSRTWLMIITWAVILGLALWAANTH
jgi:multisubunit Na+/H+ antiporter MnhE subunit